MGEICRDPLPPVEAAGWCFCNDHVEGSDICCVFREEFLEPIFEVGKGCIGVDADGPEPGLLCEWLPELLRNPEDVLLCKGPARESVGQNPKALFCKGTEGVAIKSMAGSDKQQGLKSLSAEYREPGTNPLLLD